MTQIGIIGNTHVEPVKAGLQELVSHMALQMGTGYHFKLIPAERSIAEMIKPIIQCDALLLHDRPKGFPLPLFQLITQGKKVLPSSRLMGGDLTGDLAASNWLPYLPSSLATDKASLPSKQAQWRKQFPFIGQTYFFQHTQIYPGSMTEIVLDVFARYPKHTLVMVGDWNASQYAQALRSSYKNYAHIHLLDSKANKGLIAYLRKHAFACLEGFQTSWLHHSLMESMEAGLPVIAYDSEFNREATDNSALYFSHHMDLIRCLDKISLSGAEQISSRMREAHQNRTEWKALARQYARGLKGHL